MFTVDIFEQKKSVCVRSGAAFGTRQPVMTYWALKCPHVDHFIWLKMSMNSAGTWKKSSSVCGATSSDTFITMNRSKRVESTEQKTCYSLGSHCTSSFFNPLSMLRFYREKKIPSWQWGRGKEIKCLLWSFSPWIYWSFYICLFASSLWTGCFEHVCTCLRIHACVYWLLIHAAKLYGLTLWGKQTWLSTDPTESADTGFLSESYWQKTLWLVYLWS